MTRTTTIAQCPTWDATDAFRRAVAVHKNRRPNEPYGYYRDTQKPITSPDTLVTWSQ